MAQTSPLTFATEPARAAFVGSVTSFVDAAEAMPEHDLLGASRCHGWTRMDVVVHVLAGWQEMLGGMVSPTPDPPSVDAASYWPAFADEYSGHDPVAALMSQRRRTAAYLRPASALEQLRDVADAVVRGAGSLAEEGRYAWQGHVFTTGDFLAIWAVEDVVHHLDLLAEAPPPPDGMTMARRTVEALVGDALPASWADTDVVLVGTGRRPAPDELAGIRERLPAFG